MDEARIALWGSSFSGAQVVALAACDDRVRAVISNVPFASIGDVAYDDETKAFASMKSQILDRSGSGLADQQSEPMGPFNVVREEGSELPVFIDKPEAQTWFSQFQHAAGSTWKNTVTLRSCFMTEPKFAPRVYQ